ncbi:hypothetical protein X766_15580 [Mesorhizobium sp. LSJC255A00]|nr:hypothetical protein X766_15580 [Mesorhizobium sp. LSJC255A00]
MQQADAAFLDLDRKNGQQGGGEGEHSTVAQTMECSFFRIRRRIIGG